MAASALSAVISSSKRKYWTEKPSWTARTPSPTTMWLCRRPAGLAGEPPRRCGSRRRWPASRRASARSPAGRRSRSSPASGRWESFEVFSDRRHPPLLPAGSAPRPAAGRERHGRASRRARPRPAGPPAHRRHGRAAERGELLPRRVDVELHARGVIAVIGPPPPARRRDRSSAAHVARPRSPASRRPIRPSGIGARTRSVSLPVVMGLVAARAGRSGPAGRARRSRLHP